jgi:hypothetical protein
MDNHHPTILEAATGLLEAFKPTRAGLVPVTIRIPATLLEDLRKQAIAERRSLNSQIIFRLENHDKV